jgi:hypothetical protein
MTTVSETPTFIIASQKIVDSSKENSYRQSRELKGRRQVVDTSCIRNGLLVSGFDIVPMVERTKCLRSRNIEVEMKISKSCQPVLANFQCPAAECDP